MGAEAAGVLKSHQGSAIVIAIRSRIYVKDRYSLQLAYANGVEELFM